MKFLFILLINFIIVSSDILIGEKKFDNYSLSNFLFLVNFNNNSLTLNNYDNTNQLNIKYEKFYENNSNNIINNKIEFNYILYDEFDIYSSIQTIMDNDYYLETLNIMSYSINNYAKNSLEVLVYLSEFQFQNMENDFIINLSFNSPVNYDGEYYLEAKDYIIVFSEKAVLDDNKKSVGIERFGNNFYLSFSSFKDYLLFNYTIYYNNYN